MNTLDKWAPAQLGALFLVAQYRLVIGQIYAFIHINRFQ